MLGALHWLHLYNPTTCLNPTLISRHTYTAFGTRTIDALYSHDQHTLPVMLKTISGGADSRPPGRHLLSVLFQA